MLNSSTRSVRNQCCSYNIITKTPNQVEQYNKILDDLTDTMTEIHKEFIAPDGPNQINLEGEVMRTLHVGMKTVVTSTLPAMESIFSEAQEKIESLVYNDIYHRFVRYQMTTSASRALTNDRNKYQGLGDCFCLTNPRYIVPSLPIIMFGANGYFD